MSNDALQQLVADVTAMPAADQELVVQFVNSVKDRQREMGQGARPLSSSLTQVNGLLVFTGTLPSPEINWVEQIREAPPA